MSSNELSFVIVGGQRCGTTALGSALAQHPLISVAEREVEFFESGVFERSSSDRFQAFLDRQPHADCLGIKRPEYLYDPDAVLNMQALYPEMKIIVTIRNPVSRLLSALSWYQRDGLAPIDSPDQVILPMLRSGGNPVEGWPYSAELLEFGRYSAGIERYARAYGPDNVLITSLESFGPREFDRVTKFLLGHHSRAQLDLDRIDRNQSNNSLALLKIFSLLSGLAPSLKGPHTFDIRPLWRQRPTGYLARGLLSAASDRIPSRWFEQVPRASAYLLSELEKWYEQEKDEMASTLRPIVGATRSVELLQTW